MFVQYLIYQSLHCFGAFSTLQWAFWCTVRITLKSHKEAAILEHRVCVLFVLTDTNSIKFPNFYTNMHLPGGNKTIHVWRVHFCNLVLFFGWGYWNYNCFDKTVCAHCLAPGRCSINSSSFPLPLTNSNLMTSSNQTMKLAS